jgi:hypothetical protein
MSSTASFTITIAPFTATPPTLNLPANITLAATSDAGAVVTYTASATPASGTTLESFSCTPASGSTFAVATTTVTCKATDADGGTATGTFTVTVTPQATTPAAQIVALRDAVASSDINPGLRFLLVGLLDEALASLNRSQFGPFFAVEIRALDERSGSCCGRGCGGGDGACRALAKFAAVIESDQDRRHPKIPASLASSWISTANAIETSLGCRVPGRDGHRGRDRHQRHNH